MIITLTPEQERLVTERVGSGQYLHPEHLASVALRLLTAHEQHEQELTGLRQDIDVGWEEAENGNLLDGPQMMAALLQRTQVRLERQP